MSATSPMNSDAPRLFPPLFAVLVAVVGGPLAAGLVAASNWARAGSQGRGLIVLAVGALLFLGVAGGAMLGIPPIVDRMATGVAVVLVWLDQRALHAQMADPPTMPVAIMVIVAVLAFVVLTPSPRVWAWIITGSELARPGWMGP